MDLKKLAAKPKLERIVIDEPHIIEEFGEPLEFYMWDRQPMNTYVRLSNVDTRDIDNMIEEIRGLILDQEGKRMLENDDQLPITVLLSVINAVVTRLGNFKSQTLAA